METDIVPGSVLRPSRGSSDHRNDFFRTGSLRPRRSFVSRLLSVVPIGLLAFVFSAGTGCIPLNQEDDDDLTNLLILGSLFLIASNPCNSTASPTVASALHSAASLTGRATVTGRVATLTGAPVIAAVVIAQSSSVNHFSTLSSVNRDGTFYLSGLPTGATYKIAIESINTDFQGRIATHVDCFQTPAAFTDGWYGGPGVSLVSTSAAGTGVTLSTANEIRDLGTILLNQ